MTTTSRPPRRWTIEAVRGIGLTTDVETAGAILGIGRSKAYELAKDGSFPVRGYQDRPAICGVRRRDLGVCSVSMPGRDHESGRTPTRPDQPRA
jgi:hypothetical protein